MKPWAQHAIQDSRRQIDDECMAHEVAAGVHGGKRAQQCARRDITRQRPDVFTDKVAGAPMLARGRDRVDDHHARGSGHGDVHRRLAHRVVRAMQRRQHPIQGRHHHETAAKAEQYRRDAAQTAKQRQHQIDHVVARSGKAPR